MILSISKRMAVNQTENSESNSHPDGVYTPDGRSERKFSLNYSALHQAAFLRHLDGEEYEGAKRILKTLPSGRNIEEQFERLIVIAEGYRMLCCDLEEEGDRLAEEKSLEEALEEALKKSLENLMSRTKL